MASPSGYFIRDVWRSATDLRFYGEAARLPFGVALRHLLKIVLAALIAVAAAMTLWMIFVNPSVIWLRDNLPVITIRDGSASSDVDEPFVREHGGKEGAGFAVIVDTQGKAGDSGSRYPNAILIKRRGFVVKSGDRTISREFPRGTNLVIDRRFFNAYVMTSGKIAAACAGLLGLVCAQSLGGALVGRAMAAARGRAPSFRAALQMSFYALALALCFSLVIALFFLISGRIISLVYFFLTYVFIHIGFLVGGVLSGEKGES